MGVHGSVHLKPLLLIRKHFGPPKLRHAHSVTTTAILLLLLTSETCSIPASVRMILTKKPLHSLLRSKPEAMFPPVSDNAQDLKHVVVKTFTSSNTLSSCYRQKEALPKTWCVCVYVKHSEQSDHKINDTSTWVLSEESSYFFVSRGNNPYQRSGIHGSS